MNTLTIVTTNYNANYPTVYDQFRNDGKAGSQVKFDNLYDWLSGYQLFKIPTSRFLNKAIKVTTDRSMPGLKSVEKGDIVRYYDQDSYVLYRKYQPNTNILEIEDFMSEVSVRKQSAGNTMLMENYIGRLFTRQRITENSSKNFMIPLVQFTVENSIAMR